MANRPGKGISPDPGIAVRDSRIGRADLEAAFERYLAGDEGRALVALWSYGARQARRGPEPEELEASSS